MVLQRKLCEHGFPDLLIFEAFIDGGYTGIDRVEDATEHALEHFPAFIIEISGFLHIATHHHLIT